MKLFLSVVVAISGLAVMPIASEAQNSNSEARKRFELEESSRHRALAKASKQLSFTVKLDRQVYFPSEAAVLSTYFKNTLEIPVEVHNPLDPGIFFPIVLRRQEKSPEKTDVVFYDHYIGGPEYHPSGIWLAPGETQETRVSLEVDAKRRGHNFSQMHLSAGRYILDFSNRSTSYSARVEFEVVEPMVEEFQFVSLTGPDRQDLSQRAQTGGRARLLMCLSYAGKYYLALSNHEFAPYHIAIGRGYPLLAGHIAGFSPYTRFAEGHGRIAALRATSNADDSILVTWEDDTGEHSDTLRPQARPK